MNHENNWICVKFDSIGNYFKLISIRTDKKNVHICLEFVYYRKNSYGSQMKAVTTDMTKGGGRYGSRTIMNSLNCETITRYFSIECELAVLAEKNVFQSTLNHCCSFGCDISCWTKQFTRSILILVKVCSHPVSALTLALTLLDRTRTHLMLLMALMLVLSVNDAIEINVFFYQTFRHELKHSDIDPY